MKCKYSGGFAHMIDGNFHVCVCGLMFPRVDRICTMLFAAINVSLFRMMIVAITSKCLNSHSL